MVGPNGFTNHFADFDPRPGGAWRFTMRGPNDAEFPNESVFLEVTPARIVIDHVSGPRYRMFATFDARDARTEVAVLQRFSLARYRDAVLKFAPTANEENLDRLEAELARMGHAG